ncbi:MAG: class I SAM-dependent methyltransferase [Bacilli bacterium]|nr:class I SAM-dependent methyltransferase [Bacilli bacterium]
MANQYFENNEKLSSEIREISYYFKGVKISFFADNGVFSKSGIDFGSNLLLKTISLDGAKNILDVGCGYGTIGVTLAKINSDINVTMVDVNLRAIGLCKLAIEKNGLKNALVFESNVYENVVEKYDVIVSNPPIRAGKSVVHNIILGAYDHLVEDGSMWCVIQKKQGADSAKKALKELYKSVEVVEKDKGYEIIKATK